MRNEGLKDTFPKSLSERGLFLALDVAFQPSVLSPRRLYGEQQLSGRILEKWAFLEDWLNFNKSPMVGSDTRASCEVAPSVGALSVMGGERKFACVRWP